ncbi:sigma-70 family RNA polymerase sigma factor [Candidatus Uabimicrobium amorphum]|uniref:Uncharacterized protein n=1 Tax=Uabimicrobium amorphum TaxID=2596890 RepID=A0A5S9ISQ8_UABAM|nr:sigma-70 family RNA polymerase sigma factor [Candidatus Uabimicrobium amorphum]BBM87234.1 hypothetical protein UABAM_05637 [Candidatus Uabimicrobium amorphum]
MSLEKKHQNLKYVSTHSEYVKWLGAPDHEQYQECWRKFYHRYHTPIINYILKKAGWRKDHIYKAEEIASVVYEKGFRWSFKKQDGVSFRAILKRLVKDALSDYMKKQKDVPLCEHLSEDPKASQDSDWDSLSFEILQTISLRVLEGYKGRQRDVVKWIWEHGKWPKPGELAAILSINSDHEENNKNAAKQWRKRNKNLWQDFQEKLKHQICQLAMGEDCQEQEMSYFENLKNF